MLYTTPTPLEQAHACFLLQTCFSSPNLPISGREAVSFLTRSNLPRSLLREIWNIVDPHQDGKLISNQQWWTCLKLVALAQQFGGAQDVSLLTRQVHAQCSLPIFNGVTTPSPSVLMQQFSPLHAPLDFNSPKQTTSLTVALEELAVGIQDKPLPSLDANGGVVNQPQQQEDDDDFGDFENAPAAPPLSLESTPVAMEAPPTDFDSPRQLYSLSSALEEVGGTVEDAPLPSLKQQQEKEDDDFGDFEAPPPVNAPNSTNAAIENVFGFDSTTHAVVPLESALDELGSAQDAPLPSLDAFGAAVNNEQQKQGGFGDFEAPVESTVALPTPSAVVPLESALDELCSAQDAPLPSLDAFGAAVNNEQQQQGDFGDFEAPVESTVALPTPSAVVPLESALDELGPAQDVPLPSLDAFGATVNSKQQEPDDDFGDFEAPVESTVALPTPSVVPLASALDEIGPAQDVPLPSLDAISATVNEKRQDQEEEQEPDDVFGDFEAPVESTVALTAPSIVPLETALDELGSAQDAPLPSLDAFGAVDNGGQQEQGDDFGDFEAPPTEMMSPENAALPTPSVVLPLESALDEIGSAQDAPLPSLDAFGATVNSEQQEDDDFVETPTPVESTVALPTPSVVLPLESALDEIGSAQDAPLPSLDAFGTSVNSEPQQEKQENDDDFGDFENAPEGEVAVSTAQDTLESTTPSTIVPLASALDELGSAQDAPLPSLDAFGAAVNSEQQDSFGDFENAPANFAAQDAPMDAQMNDSQAPTEMSPALPTPSAVLPPLESALDELGSAQDAPLPSLDAFGAAMNGGDGNVVNDTDVKDEFGDFGEAPSVPESGDDTHDALSRALDSLGPVNDAPLPSLGNTAQAPKQVNDDNEEEDFGDFEAPGIPQEAPSDPLSSALNSLGPVEDAPLPSRDSTAQAPKLVNDNEDFGEFEEPPPAKGTMPSNGPVSSVVDSVDDAPMPSLGDVSGAFGGFGQSAAQPTLVPLSSALDELGSSHDVPLPTLDAFASAAGNEQEDDEEDDDFGDFEDAPTQQAVDPADPEADKFAGTENAPSDVVRDEGLLDEAPSLPSPNEVESTNSEDDKTERKANPNDLAKIDDPLSLAFDSIEPVQDAPLPSLDSHLHENGEDEFGGFEAPLEENGQSGEEKPEPAADTHDTLSAALDALGPVQDAPLPSLEAHAIENKIEQSNDDSFGDFEDAPKVDEAKQSEQPDIPLPPPYPDTNGDKDVDNDDPFASAFDEIAPIENSPLPLLGMHKTGEDAVVVEEEETEASEFGDFEAATPAVEATLDVTAVEAGEKDETGLTNSEPQEDDAAPAGVGLAEEMSTSSEDDFGDFEDAVEDDNANDNIEAIAKEESSETVEDQRATARGIPEADDPFSAFTKPSAAPLPSFHSASGSDFSGFETASENISSEEKKGDFDVVSDANVGGFGDFAEQPSATVPGSADAVAAQEPKQVDHDDDDFGDFTAVEAPKEDDGAFDADWGDFEEPTIVSNALQVPNSGEEEAVVSQKAVEPSFDPDFGTEADDMVEEADKDADGFGDFDSFQKVEHPPAREETLEDIKIRIQEMHKKLNVQTSNGGAMDITKNFDNGVGGNQSSGWRLGFNANAQKKQEDSALLLQRARRCCQVMSLLTTSHKETIRHWERIISVVRDELAMGSFLLEEAKSLSGEKIVLTSLGGMVAGLAEYVRVIRSIASTLCDLLGVDVKADGAELKNRITLLDSTLGVEDLWKSVQQAATGLDLVIPRLESISEIRSKCLSISLDDETLCQLTLQPLLQEDKCSTSSLVQWDGRDYMACAANFWANRISTDTPM